MIVQTGQCWSTLRMDTFVLMWFVYYLLSKVRVQISDIKMPHMPHLNISVVELAMKGCWSLKDLRIEETPTWMNHGLIKQILLLCPSNAVYKFPIWCLWCYIPGSSSNTKGVKEEESDESKRLQHEDLTLPTELYHHCITLHCITIA